MAQISWANAAIDDLQSVREYFESISPALAERMLNQIVSRTRQLALFPHSGRVVPEFDNSVLREIRVGNYRIIYRVKTLEKVEIARVFHSSQYLASEGE